MSGFAELADDCPLLAAIGLAAGRSRFDPCKNLLDLCWLSSLLSSPQLPIRFPVFSPLSFSFDALRISCRKDCSIFALRYCS